ncbi:hypothetical protein Zmor_005628 [Zophobas morio]|uniref:Myeloid differentiation primary response protein MyD88 n=1 Tax=Zophobas morio TaxID=2755281 RepID=A0AA38MM25_9CUCU|nr:hypothetical protein Zmor_005628 [Zophobas morio]
MEKTNDPRDIPIKALRPKTKGLISDLLNPQTFISTPDGIMRNWQGLAGLCKINGNYEASLVNNPDPTSKVLNLWQTQDPDDSTIKQFILFLEEMDRFDVVADIDELIDEDIRIYRENPQRPVVKPVSLEADKYIITTHDVETICQGRPLENYDAFLLYDEDDSDFAIQVLETMEKDYNMRLCCKGHLLGGGLEMDKVITLITQRCNRVVVILSDTLFKSSVNDYLVRFTQAFGIASDTDRKIVPIAYKDVTIQSVHIGNTYILNYKRMLYFNFWDRLRDSIRVGDIDKMKLARSKPDKETTKSAVNANNDYELKPLHQAVQLNNLDAINRPPSNLSTSADSKEEKKSGLFKMLKEHLKKEKNNSVKQKAKKNKQFYKKHIKEATTVAN